MTESAARASGVVTAARAGGDSYPLPPGVPLERRGPFGGYGPPAGPRPPLYTTPSE
ncbi:hypothetical protein ABZ357_31025 [Streptomyces sp. NPDC005917]|uniref:hypothetical protein n=1 Tax=unclassified Streptomyces TaxID=2593676 RepID=UPI00340B9236